MFYLADILPFLKRIKKLPLTRDQLFLIIAAVNEFFMGLDTYSAHVLNGTIHWNEWIPIVFGTTAGILLLFACLIARKKRGLANILATIVFLASIAVGFMGSFFHITRGAILPAGPILERLHISFLIWAPPAMAPLAFVMVGVLGISAAWVEDPVGSGKLRISAGRSIQMPFSKTQAYFWMICFGILVTLVSAALDHARSGYVNPWLWLPLLTPVFAATVSLLLGLKKTLDYGEIWIFFIAMLLMGLVGVLGFFLHLNENLTQTNWQVLERYLRGAPFLAPLLYANMAAMGLIVLVDPHEN
jgi:hypothetical protein